MSEMTSGKRQLVEVIKALRSDIQTAMHESTGELIRFDVDEITVDLKTVITTTGKLEAGGKIEFNILGLELGKVSAKAKGEMGKQTEHTISLKLKPKIQNPNTGEAEGVALNDLD